jgi:[NiFe] hydrogenase diaphorase moiety large subunit
MDILLDYQAEEGYLSREIVGEIADILDMAEVDVEQTISFYHFFQAEPHGKYTVYLNNSVVSSMMGRETIASCFEDETGISFNSVSEDGRIGLFDTACIGMSDQEPAAIINGVVFTRLTPFRVRELVRDMKAGKSVEEMQVAGYGESMNDSAFLKTTIRNNIMKKGAVILSDYQYGSALSNLKTGKLSPEDVIGIIRDSGIRGRGGAGFPTGLKWEFCRKVESDTRYIFCNADEGEPGTFKDRVILTEHPKLVFEGMTLAAYAVGATRGILYIRHEYRYMKKYLEDLLDHLREDGWLGRNIGGKKGFDFDIRIQFGAGAYVCGEESALIESAEGKRGEPRDRPPFPVEVGYLNKPTVVNNVETLCACVKIISNGVDWYRSLGTEKSTGTKLLCISGDCRFPGIYEIEWGFSVRDILDMVGTELRDVQAVQVGGPSGSCIAPEDFNRILSYEDLATGGSLIIFNNSRNLLKDVVLNFMDFFIDESCGSCVPCRALTRMYRINLEKIIAGHGKKKDLRDMLDWALMMKANRCGLGQTAANPILTTLKNFPEIYESLISGEDGGFVSSFNLNEAVRDYCEAAGRDVPLEVQ